MLSSRSWQRLMLVFLTLSCHLCACAPSHEKYILSPSSRTLRPKSVYRTTGNVKSKSRAIDDVFTLTGPKASITYDFGQMVAGVPTMKLHNAACAGKKCSKYNLPSFTCKGDCQGLGLAFSEAKAYVGPESDLSTINTAPDGILFLPMTTEGLYTVPNQWGRGSFRYLTLSFSNATSPKTKISVQFSSLHFTAAPKTADNKLRVYSGYFDSSDDLLNRIWYAGAYTLQLCHISANSSVDHIYVAYGKGWSNGAQCTSLAKDDVVFVDGAKRDRNPWTGDYSTALRATLVTLNDNNLRAVRNGIQANIVLQEKKRKSKNFGYFPYAGSPLGDLLIEFGSTVGINPYGSDTYHLWTIHSFAEYLLATGDVAWAKKYWTQIVTGVKATYPFVNGKTGLFNGTRTQDWGRIGQGGQNTALNAIYYRTLTLLAEIASMLPVEKGASAKDWRARAAKIKKAANSLLYDSNVGLYRDNTTTAGHKLYPQDGNSLAIEFGLTYSPKQAQTIAKHLSQRLTKYGTPAPELPGSISPFITSHELYAQFLANPGDSSPALRTMRTQWAYMMESFSRSTLVEGYGSNGALTYGFYGNANSFISHAHAWSTGPSYSLLHDVVGIQATWIGVNKEDGSWAFKPTPSGSDLTHASGGFKTADGDFNGSWKLAVNRFNATVKSPKKLTGTIYVPTFMKTASQLHLTLDGEEVSHYKLDGPYIRIPNVTGGTHSIDLRY